MFDVLTEISWIAVLAAWVAYTVLGGVWFAVLFPRAYNLSLGRHPDAAPVKALIFFVGPAACTLLTSITTAVLMYALKIDTYGDAVLFAVISGVGYLVANTTNIAINPNFPRPLLYALISGSYNLLGIMIASVLIVAIR
jgi:hypothetical protein